MEISLYGQDGRAYRPYIKSSALGTGVHTLSSKTFFEYFNTAMCSIVMLLF
jgi:hypothetical protein